MLEKFEGTLDKIRFYNEDNGYLVGSLRLSDGKTLTIIGNVKTWWAAAAGRFITATVNSCLWNSGKD